VRVILRRATPADLELLLALMADFYAESGYTLERDIAAAALAPLLAPEGPVSAGAAWLIEVEGGAAGHVVVTYAHSMEFGGRVATIDDLFVRPSWRGRGLASRALAQLRDGAQREGVRAMRVETGHDNAAAVAVYRRAGFSVVERLHLTLPLAPPTHVQE